MARGERVIGPYSSAVINQFTVAKKLEATDMILRAGSQDWRPLQEFLAQTANEVTRESIAAMREIKITCFGCYAEVTLTVAPGVSVVSCPECDSAIQVDSSSTEESSDKQAFTGIGGSLSERVQQRMHEAYAAEGAENAIFGKLVKGILR